MKLNVRGLFDGNGKLRNFLGRRRMETEICQFCVSQMDGNGSLPILHCLNGRKWRFADFAFPKRTEMEVCQFRVSKMDGNGGLPIMRFRNGPKRRFADYAFPETHGNGDSVCIHFRQARFLFSVSGSMQREAEVRHCCCAY